MVVLPAPPLLAVAPVSETGGIVASGGTVGPGGAADGSFFFFLSAGCSACASAGGVSTFSCACSGFTFFGFLPDWASEAATSSRPGIGVTMTSMPLASAVRTVAGNSYGRGSPGTGRIAATGWQKDAESLDAVMNLPPGWRLLAVFGADWSDGDWLTSWSLFDVFMLLVVTLAVWRLWGWKAGTVTLVGVLVIYHEARAPLLSWVILVAVLAASRLVKNVGAEPLLRKARAAALLLLAFNDSFA